MGRERIKLAAKRAFVINALPMVWFQIPMNPCCKACHPVPKGNKMEGQFFPCCLRRIYKKGIPDTLLRVLALKYPFFDRIGFQWISGCVTPLYRIFS
jgi:hypothetical protein